MGHDYARACSAVRDLPQDKDMSDVSKRIAVNSAIAAHRKVLRAQRMHASRSLSQSEAPEGFNIPQ